MNESDFRQKCKERELARLGNPIALDGVAGPNSYSMHYQSKAKLEKQQGPIKKRLKEYKINLTTLS